MKKLIHTLTVSLPLIFSIGAPYYQNFFKK